MKAVAVSPAKVILFGEHFVVGGNSAISMTINLPTTVTAEQLDGAQVTIESEDLGLKAAFSQTGTAKILQNSGLDAEKILQPIFEAARFTLDKLNQTNQGLKLSVKSQVPIGMGLGSSAATAVGTVSAITRLLDRPFSKKEIFDASYALERMVHGHPSGIDQATVTYGGLISYRNGQVQSTLQTVRPPLLVIGNTGKRRSTGEFVGRVTRLRETERDRYAKIASQAQEISEHAIDALRKGGAEELGRLMDENQRLLELVGVSSPELENLISIARSAGAYGAKLTGGGGGGCMIAAVDEKNRERVTHSIRDAGGQVVPSEYVPYGVQASLSEE